PGAHRRHRRRVRRRDTGVGRADGEPQFQRRCRRRILYPVHPVDAGTVAQSSHRGAQAARPVLGRVDEGGARGNPEEGDRMRQSLGLAIVAIATLVGTSAAPAETLRVGWCARTVTSAAAPFAIANKMGWFKAAGGFDVELAPLPGSTDCIKYVGTGEVRYALPSVEPLASLRPQG